MWRLVTGLNEAAGEQGIGQALLARTFEREWGELNSALGELTRSLAGAAPHKRSRPQPEMLEEVLMRLRTIERQLIPAGPRESDSDRGNPLKEAQVLDAIVHVVGRHLGSEGLQDLKVRGGPEKWDVEISVPVPDQMRRQLRMGMAKRGVRAAITAPALASQLDEVAMVERTEESRTTDDEVDPAR